MPYASSRYFPNRQFSFGEKEIQRFLELSRDFCQASGVMEQIWLGREVSFEAAYARQLADVESILAGTSSSECVLMLEHSPVYTIGRTRDASSLREPLALPFPVVETNRGGQATYHGPGQLVGYPIVDLNRRERDLHLYLRVIEDSLIKTCEDFGVKAIRREGLTGVWVGQKKLASIGVGVRKWVTMHGFAINIERESLMAFSSITPCGLDGVSMSCLHDEMEQAGTTSCRKKLPGTQDFAAAFMPRFCELLEEFLPQQ